MLLLKLLLLQKNCLLKSKSIKLVLKLAKAILVEPNYTFFYSYNSHLLCIKLYHNICLLFKHLYYFYLNYYTTFLFHSNQFFYLEYSILSELNITYLILKGVLYMVNNNDNKALLWIAILILIIFACSKDNSSRPVNFDTYFGL